MRLNFREWLLVENTVAQMLKNIFSKNQDLYQDGITSALGEIRKEIWAANKPQELINSLAKWFVFLTHKKYGFTHYGRLGNAVPQTAKYVLTYFSDFLSTIMDDNPNEIKSKLNNPNYSEEQMDADNTAWHQRIADRKRKPAGNPGRVVEIAGMPPGWTWVSLDKGYCQQEGDAMGHCGNAGFHPGDNIYSLRDTKGMAYLTFIVNNQRLGESKGTGNTKPSERYHPHIVAILLGQDRGKDIIEYISGGGYLPENNFEFTDLNQQLQQKVLAVKPHINDRAAFYTKRYGTVANEIVDLEKKLKTEFYGYRDGKIIVTYAQNDDMLIDWLNEHGSDIEKRFPYGNVQSNTSIIHIFNELADDDNKRIMDDIGDLIAKIEVLEEEPEEDHRRIDKERYHYEPIIILSKNNEVYEVLRMAANTAYQDVVNDGPIEWIINKKSDAGFYSIEALENGYEVVMPLQEMERISRVSWRLGEGYNNIKVRYKFPPDPTDLSSNEMSDYSYNQEISGELENIKSDLEYQFKEAKQEYLDNLEDDSF